MTMASSRAWAQNTITTVAGGGPNSPTASSAYIPIPTGVAVDKLGNLYVVAWPLNQVLKIDKHGKLTVLAGTGVATYSGDGGPASSAGLYLSGDAVYIQAGDAVDASGNVFIADVNNNVIRRVDAATHIITTVAGNGSAGYSGDGGPATSANLSQPSGVAVDTSGNVFIADQNNNVIRRVDATTGIISSVAGNVSCTTYGSGDGGPAANACLNSPIGVAVDGAGNLFIADTYDYVIRRVDAATGIIKTVAGNANAAGTYTGDGGPATSAGLNLPSAVALDAAGNLFIADPLNYVIRRVDALTQTITTVAGNGAPGFSGDGGPATSAELNLSYVLYLGPPASLAVDAAGDLFIPDSINNRIRRVDGITGIVTEVAGGGTGGDGGLATSAILYGPFSVATDTSDNLLLGVTDFRVRRVDASTGIITTVAGTGTALIPGFPNGDGGPATSAGLSGSNWLAVDSSGNIFISVWMGAGSSNTIRRVDAATGIITTVAGTGTPGFSGDDGPATSAQLQGAKGLVLDSSGNLFIADHDNNRIRRVDATTGIITTVAGNGTAGYSGDGGPATSATLNGPGFVALDSSRNLFISDLGNHRIRRVDAKTGIITTVAGNGTFGYSGDGGPATSASFDFAKGIAVDSLGNVFVADAFNQRIRRVDATTGIITTVAGNGTEGYSGDGGPATSASLNHPYGVALDTSNHLFIADTASDRVREFTLPPFVSLSATSLTFADQVVGTTSAPQAVTLYNTGAAALGISSITTREDYAQTNTCGSSVAAGGKCTISVTFTPTTTGPLTGTLTITDNTNGGNGSSQVVSLTGTGIPGAVLVMGPQAMEGDLKLSPGTTLQVGYDFTMPGRHPTATVSFIGSNVTFAWSCVSGPGSGVLVVPMADQSYADEENSPAWYPRGDQDSSLVYQGSIAVPNVCRGRPVSFRAGGTFSSVISSTDIKDKVYVRWHYSGGSSAGGWSGTQSVVP